MDARSEASYAIQQFFLNGGTETYVVRVGSLTSGNAPTKTGVGIGDGTGKTAFVVWAQSEGAWGKNLRVGIDYGTTGPTSLFNLTVTELATVNGATSVVATESFLNLVVDPTKPNDVGAVVNAGSHRDIAADVGVVCALSEAANGPPVVSKFREGKPRGNH